MHKVTLGGERLGSGKKMDVELHGYERSTHDLGYLWRSTMSAGTLVPYMSIVGLPGDTFDIKLGCEMLTHPTTGPLFGSYKVQLDVFEAPLRLYHAAMHNNKIGIGLKMQDVKLPYMVLGAEPIEDGREEIDNTQVNPSCILHYLGIKGIGNPGEENAVRPFNAIPLLAYWEIFKNYYSNKQEENAYVIHTGVTVVAEILTDLNYGAEDIALTGGSNVLIDNPSETLTFTFSAAPTLAQLDNLVIVTNRGELVASDVILNATVVGSTITGTWNIASTNTVYAYQVKYIAVGDLPIGAPRLEAFVLKNIDDMRDRILQEPITNGLNINSVDIEPYNLILDWTGGTIAPYKFTQEGLAVKTYQSDLFNNWLNEESITGSNGINEITSIDTSGGSISVDTIILARKVYDMLNRIAVSGGTYQNWLEAVYDHKRHTETESPVYHGGLIKELVFQEVISNTGAEGEPLGTLGGRGVMSKKHKGGYVRIKVDEPCYIMGIISLTPRVDYSQGNKWDVHLKTMDDLHKPGLDQIGFQDLITEQMAWWTTTWDQPTTTWVQKSAGKQPAWINYMTATNETHGNFAVRDNEMFMTLNRRYEKNLTDNDILDLTTYIDPVKFNYSFAETALDAQNFWAQISVDITARRKMSAKIMPNL